MPVQPQFITTTDGHKLRDRLRAYRRELAA
jgi:hypothetical protein